jgi:hypothetical protein
MRACGSGLLYFLRAPFFTASIKGREEMRKLMAATIGLFMVHAAFAQGVVTGHVVHVRIDQSGKGFVYFDENVVGYPSCVISTYENAMAFDANTAGGKAIMARALAAKAMSDLMTVYGSSSCTVFGGWAEDWMYGDTE